MAERYDVVVIGGGLAGCAAAITLAEAGRAVLIIEKAGYPRDKVCGEFLSPESRGLLEALSVWPRIAALEPANIERARFRSAKGRVVSLALPGAAVGISRRALDHQLAVRAEQAGAALWCHAEVEALSLGPEGHRLTVLRRGSSPDERSTVEAPWVIGAHGRRGRIDHQLARPFVEQRSAFLGLKRHHLPNAEVAAELAGHVEIHTFDGGYCGMSFVEGGLVNVCMLIEDRVLGRCAGAHFDAVRAHLLEVSPSLAGRLRGLSPAGEGLAVAQVPFQAKEVAKDGVLFAGDAAAVMAPLAGDGQAMALESGRALARHLVEAATRPSAAERQAVAQAWTRTFRERFRPRLLLARALQGPLLRAGPAELVFGVVGRVPGAAERLARWTRSPSGDPRHGGSPPANLER